MQMCRLTGVILQGWALVQVGQEETGLAQIQQGLSAWRRQGLGASLARYSAVLAEVYRDMGRAAPGLALVTEAQALIKQHEERVSASDLWRLQGELLLVRDGQSPAATDAKRRQGEAERCFQQALDLARRQQAKMLELRAAVSLSRLWQQQAKRQEAAQLLGGVYGWFTEGFASVDLEEAKTLLTK
jgi:predicted ATPase